MRSARCAGNNIKILVLMPHDDVESNPFRVVLPQMAVKNDHLLSLLLAYSGQSEDPKTDKGSPAHSEL